MTVVVGVDGSASALEAVRWATGEAVRRGSPLRLVAAVEWTAFRPIGVPALGQDHLRDVLVRAAHDHLAAAVEQARATAPDLEVVDEVRGGAAPAVLETESDAAELLVLGTRGRGGFTGLLAGSVAVTMAAKARCPVVVVRASGAPADAPVVVGVGDAAGDAALGFAFDSAAARRVPLVAVQAWSVEALDPFLVPILDWTAIEADADAALGERLAAWSGKHPDVAVERIVVRDGAAAALVGRSVDAQLVVVGGRGHGALTGLLLGSVSQAVLQHAHCPVAVVRDNRPDSI
jgi:nucleotide-binding universal stress UspA family protein